VSLLLDVIAGLNAQGVSYVVVGGVAVVLHGRNRVTMDLDLVIRLEEPNISKTLQVLSSLGLKPRIPVDPEQFADPAIRKQWVEDRGMKVFSFTDPAKPTVSVALFASYPLNYERMLSASVEAPLGDTLARVCSIDDLIAMKRAAGRPHDLDDAAQLELIRDARQ
jgi:hypothetical protein